MCDCNNNIVDLSHLKIYTVMAEYKAKQSSGTTYKGDFKINWAIATQEELAYAYEELCLTSLVEKISTTPKNAHGMILQLSIASATKMNL